MVKSSLHVVDVNLLQNILIIQNSIMDHEVENKKEDLSGIKRKRWTTKEDNELKKVIKGFWFDWFSIA